MTDNQDMSDDATTGGARTDTDSDDVTTEDPSGNGDPTGREMTDSQLFRDITGVGSRVRNALLVPTFAVISATRERPIPVPPSVVE